MHRSPRSVIEQILHRKNKGSNRSSPAKMSLHFDKSMSVQQIINYVPTGSSVSNSSVYDMNELPYMSQSRSVLLIVCAIMFFTAGCVYMPLGYIQADYNGKCFLDTNLHFELNKKALNLSNPKHMQRLRLNPVTTQWGPAFKCNFTTFTPVMVAIFSMVIAWSTFTVWPTMMEIGKGGGLMLVYAFLFSLCLGSTIASTYMLVVGYRETCSNLLTQKAHIEINCEGLNAESIRLKADGEHIIVDDIHRAIFIAEIASMMLIGLSALQILLTGGTFGLIWFHFNFMTLELSTEDPSYDNSPGDFWQDTGTIY